jgi:GxxExxY protein
MALLFENESHSIIWACMHVHKLLGCGFLESVYQEALEKEFLKQNIPYSRHKHLHIIFDGKPLDKSFVADFVCYNSIILEIKAAAFLH